MSMEYLTFNHTTDTKQKGELRWAMNALPGKYTKLANYL